MHSLTVKENQNKKQEFQIELNRLYTTVIFKETETYGQFVMFVDKLSFFQVDCLPYAEVSRFIYELQYDEEYFLDALIKLSDKYFSTNLDNDLKVKFNKIYEHMDLASVQKAYLLNDQQNQLDEMDSSINKMMTIIKQYDKSIDEFSAVNKSIKKVNKKTKVFDDQLNKYETKFNKIENEVKGITTHFISILGIFASILLAAFGGLSILSNVFGNIKNVDTGKLLVFSSLTTLAIVFIIFMLLNGISKLTSLNIRSCGCTKDDKCNCSVWKKHPSLKYSFIISLVIIFIGLSSYVIDYERHIKGILNQSAAHPFLFFCAVTLSLVSFVISIAMYLSIEKNNVKSNNDKQKDTN